MKPRCGFANPYTQLKKPTVAGGLRLISYITLISLTACRTSFSFM
ncbi:hypothetical protein BFV94_4701 [Alteromonas macleodii]|uniref:Lipoprotein n=1 Tax=Alteromonas macleodii TaxID=28108 RepID=A0AB36FN73_ALTMA|nr:hypothetical protein BFV95_4929 [Alteromonas macleodii]OES24550.1 hypothetical protein BFV94_4701 [Alteromonas macleodii]OES25170.1 hypothetical protein BFV93_4501 [Alteromonas macleodii]OES38492.1 hypothetical protein BFV96_4903 [Alteromonas macleodii]